ncbi:MAG: class I SAM-dependent methyltransferase [Actinomycetota bacterium]
MRTFGAVTARVYNWLHGRSPANRIVLDALQLRPDDRVLEVGCGPGTAVALAAERIGAERVAAVDPSPTFVDMVRDRVPGADVQVGGAEKLPFEDGSFTAIFSIKSMHHWPDRDAGLAEQVAKLAAGGRLVVAELFLKRPGHGITADQTAEVVARLEALGMSDVRTTTEQANRRKRLQIIHATR